MKHMRYLAVLAALISVWGCASDPRITESAGRDKVLVYGFMDIEQNNEPYKLWIDGLTFRKVEPPSDTPYFHSDWILGTLFFTFVEPGFYRLEKFSSYGYISMPFLFMDFGGRAIINYKIPVQGNGVKFEKPGVYYMGTFKVINDMKFLEESSFELKRIYYPSEEDLIVRLLEITDKGCYWEGVLKKRLAQLRQWRKYYDKNKTPVKNTTAHK